MLPTPRRRARRGRRSRPRQPAVGGKTRDAVVNGVAFTIGMSLLQQIFDQLHHLRNVVGRGSDNVGSLDTELRTVFEKCSGVRRSVTANVYSLLRGFPDDLVVDIGDVHDVQQLPFALQMTPQDIFKNERSEVTNVGKVVDGRSACVHTNRHAVDGRERFSCSCKGIRQLEHRA